MTEATRKKLYWAFKILSVMISCALPIWAVCEKFPLWETQHGTTHTVGVGVILIAIVLVVVFRRTVFQFIKDRLDIKHAPPLLVWLIFLIIAYIMIFVGDFMRDMTTILWMGFIGCCVGAVFTYISQKFEDKKEGDT